MTETHLNRFVFVDVETTGLDESKDLICELGIKVTDEKLEVLGEWKSLVFNPDWRARMAANDIVWKMHTRSGLIEDLGRMQDDYTSYIDKDPYTVSLNARLWLIQDMGLFGDIHPIAGSSVQFDRDFLSVHMPVLHGFFSYRNIDVSTLKELCMRWNPELARAIKEKFSKENAKHRVLEDIDGSIEELRTYADEFLFIPGDAVVALSDDAFNGQDPLPGLGLGELKQCA